MLWGLLIGLVLGAGAILLWQRYQLSQFALRGDVTLPLTSISRESAMWQYVLQGAPFGYLQVDAENRLFWANPIPAKLLGVELIPTRLLIQLVRSYELDQLIQETRSQRRPLKKSWTYHPVAPDPLYPVQPGDLHLRAHSIPLSNGHVGIFMEDRREAVALSQQRDRWTSDVAHELKTPLTSMRLLVETLQDRAPIDLGTWLDRLLKEVIRLSDIVEDLLDLGQEDMGKPLTLQLEPLDLPALIQSVWHTLEPIASLKKVHLQYEGPEHLVFQGDETRIHRLFMNLLDNAIKFSSGLQGVRVQISPLGQQEVLIEVIDCGCGFSAESLPYVFDRFYRADPSRSRPAAEGGGSGLGLAIARQSVLMHQGTIQAANHPETFGAWIKVILPLGKSSS